MIKKNYINIGKKILFDKIGWSQSQNVYIDVNMIQVFIDTNMKNTFNYTIKKNNDKWYIDNSSSSYIVNDKDIIDSILYRIGVTESKFKLKIYNNIFLDNYPISYSTFLRFIILNNSKYNYEYFETLINFSKKFEDICSIKLKPNKKGVILEIGNTIIYLDDIDRVTKSYLENYFSLLEKNITKFASFKNSTNKTTKLIDEKTGCLLI